MLVCGHDRESFGAPLCRHLYDFHNRREPWVSYYQWYVGVGIQTELLCTACAGEKEHGQPIATALVCEECFQFVKSEVGDLVGYRGKPELRTRFEPINQILEQTELPSAMGTVADLAPITASPESAPGASIWLVLADDGKIFRFNADTSAWNHLATASVDPELDHEPWCNCQLRRRLYAAPKGDFAAVVNDFGRYGQILELRTGKVTLALDGGTYHSATVPFSFTFALWQGRSVAIHRTDWNRLNISDPSTGTLLSKRQPTSYCQGEKRPEHDLDYFHGALYLSPDGTQLLDDGWVWHPFGVPVVWSLHRWLNENVWESETGPSKQTLCGRAYYWNQAMTWLDHNRIAIGGIGDDIDTIIDGVRLFDCALSKPSPKGCTQVFEFPGPAGNFFSDGKWLYSADQQGLSRWDLNDGARTGFVPDFQATYHHRNAGELAQLCDGVLLRWKMK